MAFKYNGDATIGVSLTVEAPKPLDNRTVVDNLNELYSIPEKYAYRGMTVSNPDNGNIYMLVDKAHISDARGWKASYEAILIITCTEAEHKEWLDNTTNDFRPIDPDKAFIHSDTYYYIYEDSMDEDLFYLSASWGKLIEESLKLKALNTTVVQIRNDLDVVISNYATSKLIEEIKENYALKASLDLTDPTSFLSITLDKYYTKQETDDTFVTKESLRGEGMEGDDFVFVTQKKYSEDLLAYSRKFTTELLDSEAVQTLGITILKIEEKEVQLGITEDGTTPVVTESVVTSSVNLSTYNNRLTSGNKEFAFVEEVPKLVCLPLPDYDNLVLNNKTEQDTYYCTYGEKDILDTGYVTSEFLYEKFYTKEEVDELIRLATAELQKKIDEIAARLL